MIVARARQPARGLTVVAVLVCLIILTLVSGAVLKVGAARRELARAQERRLQSEWLAESGAQRARARLARDREYAGETWKLAPHDLGLGDRPNAETAPPVPERAAAVVAIAIERLPGDSQRRRIRIQADYPPDLPHRARHTKEFMIDLEPSPRGAVP